VALQQVLRAVLMGLSAQKVRCLRVFARTWHGALPAVGRAVRGAL